MRGTYHRRFLSLADRLDSFIGPADSNGCKPWLGQRVKSGQKHDQGYGVIKARGRRQRVTRLLWERAHGPIPGGMFVCHSCDNPACCAVDHLFLGSNADNVADKVAKGRQARAHLKLSPEQARSVLVRRSQGETLRRIGESLGVTEQAVWAIVHGKNWKWLNGEVVD